MSAALLKELIDENARFLPLRVKQYHAMIATSILPEGEPYELLDGHLVRKDRSAVGECPMTVGYDHALAVTSLTSRSGKLARLGCHMRIQQPVSLPPYNEPESDAATALGAETDYRGRHPGAKGVLCIIEVADASLRHDRSVKAHIYASSGLTPYIIVNLPDRVIEFYTQPSRRKGRYGHCAVLRPGQRVRFPAAGGRGLAQVQKFADKNGPGDSAKALRSQKS